MPGRSHTWLLGATAVIREQKWMEEPKLMAAGQCLGQLLFLPQLEVGAKWYFQHNSYLMGT